MTAELIAPHQINTQPWCVLHELAHPYHYQVLGFGEARTVDIEWQDGQLTSAGIRSLAGNPIRVRYQDRIREIHPAKEASERWDGR